MANIFIKAASGLMEKMLTPAEVTAVRVWEPATMLEIDLYLPSLSMEKWDTIKRLKCKVGEFEYRDYTPAGWDAGKKRCTLYIEAGHRGVGSNWARALKKGDRVLFGAAHAAQLPSKEGKILCLGDGSAIGHFLALKQLTERSVYPIEAGISLHENYLIPRSMGDHHPEFEFIHGAGHQGPLEDWLMEKDLSKYTSVYIAGNIPMVSGLRKRLKALPEVKAKIVGHGFWT